MKSIDDYKQIVKKLKLKLKNLQQEKIELTKIAQFPPISFYSDTQLLDLFQNKVKEIGLNMEMVFRAADIYSQQIISCARFGEVLFKIVRITPNCIDQLISLFDQDNSGSITRLEYYQTLECYNLNEEFNLDYQKHCFAKYVKFASDQGNYGKLGYLKMDFERKGYITKNEFIAFIKSLNNYQDYLNEREIVGAFQYLNVDLANKVMLKFYIHTFEKIAIQKVNIQEDSLQKKLEAFRKTLIVRNIKFADFIIGLLKQVKEPQYGITYDIFCKYTLNIMNKKDCLQFYKAIDQNESGSIDYDELIYFYMISMSQNDTLDVIFVILARKLQAINISIDKYLRLEQIYYGTELSFDEFIPIGYYLFNCKQQQLLEQIFNALDQDNSNSVSAKEIIHFTQQAINQTLPEIIIVSEDAEQISKDIMQKQKSIRESPLNELLSFIKNTKQCLEQQDYFPKTSQKQWKTIFTSEIACLISAVEFAMELRQGDKWEDPEFGPNETDQYGSNSVYINELDKISGWPESSDLKWERIMDNWEYIKDGAIANDVMQSQFLGNCWFISALSIITMNDDYIYELLPNIFHFLQKYGMLVVKIYKNNQWIYILMDDRFCYYNNELMFGKCRSPEEWWVSIIEKAYAKLHHCYEALTAGDISQALQDLTSYPGTKFKIGENSIQIIEKCQQYGSLMGCSASGDGMIMVDEENSGLYSGHAYGIMHYFKILDNNMRNERKSHRILMLRNPWGFGEWKLKWSDESEEVDRFLPVINKYFDQIQKEFEKQGLEAPERYEKGNDGIFLINFKSFRNVFDNLFVCYNLSNWNCVTFNVQSGMMPKNSKKVEYAQKNTQIILSINNQEEKNHILIQVSQYDGRLEQGQRYPFEKMNGLLICVFELELEEKELIEFSLQKKIADSKLISAKRDIDTGIFQINNSKKYCIIVSGNRVEEVCVKVFCSFSVTDLQCNQQFNIQKNLTYANKEIENMIMKL